MVSCTEGMVEEYCQRYPGVDKLLTTIRQVQEGSEE